MRDCDFGERLKAFVESDRNDAVEVSSAVSEIIAQVCERGESALAELTKRFDGFSHEEIPLKVSMNDVEAAASQCDKSDLDALQFAADRIRRFHECQAPEDHLFTDEMGVTLGWRWTPVAAAGLYAPGGRAAYPSSVLMNAVPAKVAGVRRLAMTCPAPAGHLNPLVLAAAQIAGVDEIYRVGGAQAVAALTYGAGAIKPVDVIVGPGNAYVAEAKRQVFGRVGIDSIAGPSEILVVADSDNDPEWIAADLLSQAEHDPSSQSVLITDDEEFANKVAASVEGQIAASERAEIARTAWECNSAIIVVGQIDDASALVDDLAPEHLELALAEPESFLERVRNAGAVFLGRYAPEAIGDYVAGPNHVLPTHRAARYASGLSVLTFMKRTTIIGASKPALENIGPAAARLADAEGLPSHAESIRRRLRD